MVEKVLAHGALRLLRLSKYSGLLRCSSYVLETWTWILGFRIWVFEILDDAQAMREKESRNDNWVIQNFRAPSGYKFESWLGLVRFFTAPWSTRISCDLCRELLFFKLQWTWKVPTPKDWQNKYNFFFMMTVIMWIVRWSFRHFQWEGSTFRVTLTQGCSLAGESVPRSGAPAWVWFSKKKKYCGDMKPFWLGVEYRSSNIVFSAI